MEYKAFRTLVEPYIKLWLGTALDMLPPGTNMMLPGFDVVPRINHLGIDLWDGKTGIELKCAYDRWGGRFPFPSRQIDEYCRQNPGLELFWAFAIYSLSREPCQIERAQLGDYIGEKNVWFLPWDWVRQFATHEAKTATFTYVRKKDFPPDDAFAKFEVERGILRVPRGSSLEKKLLAKP
jgi:hypothetical protein